MPTWDVEMRKDEPPPICIGCGAAPTTQFQLRASPTTTRCSDVRALLVLLIAACGSPAAPAAPTNLATPPPAPAREPAVVIQLTYRGTFSIGPPFSQLPPFTLLDDGTLIGAPREAPPFTAKVSRTEVARIVQHVEALGFGRLESHTEHCGKHDPVKQTRLCVSDAAFTNVRVGAREVSTYADFSNEPATLQAIVAYLEAYRPAATTPYRPSSGVLHVRLDHAPLPAGCPTIAAAHLGTPPAGREMWAHMIDGPALAAVLAIAKQRTSLFACSDGRLYQLAFLPAIPGFDLAGEFEIYRR